MYGGSVLTASHVFIRYSSRIMDQKGAEARIASSEDFKLLQYIVGFSYYKSQYDTSEKYHKLSYRVPFFYQGGTSKRVSDPKPYPSPKINIKIWPKAFPEHNTRSRIFFTLRILDRRVKTTSKARAPVRYTV